MHNPLGILERRMAGQALPQVFLPTILTVQRRNNCPARHPYEGRQSYHHFSLKTRYPGQNSNWSSGYSKMPRESSYAMHGKEIMPNSCGLEGRWLEDVSMKDAVLQKASYPLCYKCGFCFFLNKPLHISQLGL